MTRRRSEPGSGGSPLTGLVRQLNWSLLGLLGDLGQLSGSALRATAGALFGEECLTAPDALEVMRAAGQTQLILNLNRLDEPLAVVRPNVLPFGSGNGLDARMLRATAHRWYRDFQTALVRAFSRTRQSGPADPFEGAALLKQTWRLSHGSRRSADDLAGRVVDGVVALNLATLAVLRELPRHRPDGARLAGRLAADGVGDSMLRAVPSARVPEPLLFLVAISNPPFAVPSVDRLRELSLDGVPEEIRVAGLETRDRIQALLAEFIRMSEEECGRP
jgi:hypothetical protein